MLKRRIAHDTWARWQALDIPGRATSFSKAVLPLLSLWSSCTPLASMARRNSGVRPCSTARTRRGRLRPTCSVTRSISNTASLDRPLRHVVRLHAESTSALRPFFRQIEKTHPEIASCCSLLVWRCKAKAWITDAAHLGIWDCATGSNTSSGFSAATLRKFATHSGVRSTASSS